MRSMTYARAAALFATLALLFTSGIAAGSDPNAAVDFSGTPGVPCVGPDDKPETSTQGRVPLADFTSGRAADGYTCNASEVLHIGAANGNTGGQGGYRVHRYEDAAGRVCAYYDTTLLFPVNARSYPSDTGVRVLHMNAPGGPVQTATLRTPAMQSPHESLSLNVARGLLGAVFANPAFYHGQFDLYDVSEDCRSPQLRSTLPMGVLGHEGSFSADGNTYYASSLYGHTLTAIDTSNTLAPRILWTSAKWNVHGMNTSADGNLLYFADLARSNGEALGEHWGTETRGLTILDVSQIQARALNPDVTVVKHLTWPRVGTPQTALPMVRDGRKYVIEIDEFGGANNVGAARIIDVELEDPKAPFVVSNIRLEVNNPQYQTSPDVRQDPGATNSLGGYRGHYCAIPTENNPKIVACTFILSGLRVFDISDLQHPKEIAYHNRPSTEPALGLGGSGPQGSYAMSQPAFDVENRQIWYTDGNSGFYVVQIHGYDDVWPS